MESHTLQPFSREGGGEERSKATPPFDFAQDREPVERRFGFTQGHELVEWQMMPSNGR
jgi:hypothetical protein